MSNTLVYWIGILGIPGKGPHYKEAYDPNRTIGQIIQTMTATGHVERNKRVEMLKYQSGNVNKYDISDPYWSHDTKLVDYVNLMNGHNWKDIDLVCVFI
jgi:hypothetical protein